MFVNGVENNLWPLVMHWPAGGGSTGVAGVGQKSLTMLEILHSENDQG